MALQEELERSGNWLFRWRGYLPLVILALALVALPRSRELFDQPEWNQWWGVLCLLISFGGIGVRAATLGHVARRTSGRNTRVQRADSLNTTGMYSIVRHPLYLGNAIIGLGIILITQSWWMTLIYGMAFWLYYERIMIAEESYLRGKFGLEFMEWADRTPVFIPRWSNWRRSDFPFSTRTVLRREYNGFLALIATVFLLEVAGRAILGVRPAAELSWIIFLSAGFMIWVVVRILGKSTRLLHVDDR